MVAIAPSAITINKIENTEASIKKTRKKLAVLPTETSGNEFIQNTESIVSENVLEENAVVVTEKHIEVTPILAKEPVVIEAQKPDSAFTETKKKEEIKKKKTKRKSVFNTTDKILPVNPNF